MSRREFQALVLATVIGTLLLALTPTIINGWRYQLGNDLAASARTMFEFEEEDMSQIVVFKGAQENLYRSNDVEISAAGQKWLREAFGGIDTPVLYLEERHRAQLTAREEKLNGVGL